MNDQEIKNILLGIFKEVLDIDELGNMNEIASWDSLKHINLVMRIEKAFQISFEFYEVLDMTNFENILKIVSEKMKII